MRFDKSAEDELPESIQGLMEYRAYALNQIKENNLNNKRLEKQVIECDERIEAKEKGLTYGGHKKT